MVQQKIYQNCWRNNKRALALSANIGNQYIQKL